MNKRPNWKFRTAEFTSTLLVASLFLWTGTCLGDDTPGFRQVVAADFPHWDSNHSGELSPDEIDALIENPQVKGEEAAAVIAIRNIFTRGKRLDKSKRLSRGQLLASAEDPSVENDFFWGNEEIKSCNYALFLPGDPNLLTVQQGRMGDCYFVAVIGALVSSKPEVVRNMIKSLPGNLFEVDFPDGTKAVIPAPTDAELMQGAKVGDNHGIWLDVLEKAFAQIRFGNNQKTNGGASETPPIKVARDILPGGRTPPGMERFSGHKVVSLFLDRPNGNDPQPTAQQIHKLLVRLTQEHRLITAGSPKLGIKLPAGIVRRHCWAIVGYDPKSKLVHVFNPWGNDLEPKGTPGLINGYAVHHGVFEMPLQEFIQIFRKMNYETDQPLNG